jgi:hypothetical protein
MAQLEEVSEGDVRKLLATVSPNRAAELAALIDELGPVWLLDRESNQNLFQAWPGQPNQIRMGLKCSKRLQVHAYAAAVILSSVGKPKAERDQLLAPVDRMLNWAVGVDLTRWTERGGISLPLDHVLRATDEELPADVLPQLNKDHKTLGMGLFRYASAWVLLHELGHLTLGHTYKEGYPSLAQEKEADRFAAEWMADSASDSRGEEREFDRLGAIFGIAIALLWLTVFNVYFGPKEAKTHPEGYDRLFQVLDQIIDRSDEQEYLAVWQSVSTLLFIHMRSASYEFDDNDALHMQGDPRAEASYLIDRISRFDRKK